MPPNGMSFSFIGMKLRRVGLLVQFILHPMRLYLEYPCSSNRMIINQSSMTLILVVLYALGPLQLYQHVAKDVAPRTSFPS